MKEGQHSTKWETMRIVEVCAVKAMTVVEVCAVKALTVVVVVDLCARTWQFW